MLQENLDCRPKNYKKVGTVQGIKIEEEDPLSPSNVKNSNLNWRETRKRKKDKIMNQIEKTIAIAKHTVSIITKYKFMQNS